MGQIDDYESGPLELIAEIIAIETGALRRCPVHSDAIYAANDDDALQAAYRRAAWLFKHNRDDPRLAAANSQADVTDAIRDRVGDAGDYCASCDKNASRR